MPGDSGSPGINANGEVAAITSHGTNGGVYLNIHDASDGGPGLWLQQELAKRGIDFNPSGYDRNGNPIRLIDAEVRGESLDAKKGLVEGEVVDVASGQVLASADEPDGGNADASARSDDRADNQSTPEDAGSAAPAAKSNGGDGRR